jgi:hypothetical protein
METQEKRIKNRAGVVSEKLDNNSSIDMGELFSLTNMENFLHLDNVQVANVDKDFSGSILLT